MEYTESVKANFCAKPERQWAFNRGFYESNSHGEQSFDVRLIKKRLLEIERPYLQEGNGVETIRKLRMTIPNQKFTIFAIGTDGSSWTQTSVSKLIFPGAP